MAESIFDSKARQPTRADLLDAVGETAEQFRDLEQRLTDEYGQLTPEWKFYGKRAGWTLALGCKGRRILHLIPRSGLFTVVLTLGKKAALACREARLPEEVLSSIENAREYAEGRSIRLDVRTSKDVRIVTRIAIIKMSH